MINKNLKELKDEFNMSKNKQIRFDTDVNYEYFLEKQIQRWKELKGFLEEYFNNNIFYKQMDEGIAFITCSQDILFDLLGNENE